ncbi:MAG: isomerizing glutamine--fructose-6-phosphate transaminase, partial [Bacteroidales bacterium]|nr:isomerizing glutamine--fructose-6-phosphate transaminase [Bacteroidales bacterium]
MCGIVAYIGKKQAYPILIKGLKRLEYRGYDSAGVALINDNQNLSVYKTKGKVADLEHFVKDKNISGTVGIAHTRWATHGEPNDKNAHPHFSENEDLALIHNGIIENYCLLKEELAARGRTFHSDTDTEVLVQLIDYIKANEKCDLVHAVQMALSQVTGAYAIAILSKENPDLMIAARKGSPLVVGVGQDEFLLGSDASPIIEFTKDVVYVNDEEVVVIERGKKLKVTNLKNIKKTPRVQTLELSLEALEKGSFPHFMLKEIFEQPKTLKDSMRGRISNDLTQVALSGIIDNKERFINARRILIVACGTSWHAGLVGEYIIEELIRIPVEVEYASV